MNWLLVILGLLALCALFFAYYVGFLDMRSADVRVLKSYHFLYSEHQSDYVSLFGPFVKMVKVMQEEFEPEERCLHGCFFDRVDDIVDKNQCRSAIGIAVRGETGLAKAREFIKKDPSYKLIELPEVRNRRF